MSCIQFLLLSLFFKLVHTKCLCLPLFKCKSEDLDDYYDIGINEEVNLWGFPCENDFDVCCKFKCGQRQTENLPFNNIRDRILGTANEANFAEFPWMLAILEGNSYTCGGSLIHPQVALTAAHCVDKKKQYKVRGGEWDRRSRSEPLKHQNRFAKKIIIHPRFNPNSLANDIALVILDRPFQLADNIGVVCLPPHNSSPFPPECVVTGWGKTSHSSIQNPSILNKATFPVVPHRKCEMALQTAHLGPLFRLDSSFMCAGGGNKDTCKGDGGSPLMCGVRDEENTYEQFGIVSWGLVCGVKQAPGVYVSVAKFVEWIDQQMALHGFDTGVYKRS